MEVSANIKTGHVRVSNQYYAKEWGLKIQNYKTEIIWKEAPFMGVLVVCPYHRSRPKEFIMDAGEYKKVFHLLF